MDNEPQGRATISSRDGLAASREFQRNVERELARIMQSGKRPTGHRIAELGAMDAQQQRAPWRGVASVLGNATFASLDRAYSHAQQQAYISQLSRAQLDASVSPPLRHGGHGCGAGRSLSPAKVRSPTALHPPDSRHRVHYALSPPARGGFGGSSQARGGGAGGDGRPGRRMLFLPPEGALTAAGSGQRRPIKGVPALQSGERSPQFSSSTRAQGGEALPSLPGPKGQRASHGFGRAAACAGLAAVEPSLTAPAPIHGVGAASSGPMHSPRHAERTSALQIPPSLLPRPFHLVVDGPAAALAASAAAAGSSEELRGGGGGGGGNGGSALSGAGVSGGSNGSEGAFIDGRGGVAVEWDQSNSRLRATLFPANAPTGRKDVRLLQRWMATMLARLAVNAPGVGAGAGSGGSARSRAGPGDARAEARGGSGIDGGSGGGLAAEQNESDDDGSGLPLGPAADTARAQSRGGHSEAAARAAEGALLEETWAVLTVALHELARQVCARPRCACARAMRPARSARARAGCCARVLPGLAGAPLKLLCDCHVP